MSAESRARPKVMDFPRLMERYGSEDKALAYLEELRWPDGARCPKDNSKTSWISTRRVHECHSCGYQFTVRIGTVFQDSKLPLWKWFIAVFLMAESRKGISANQVRRMTGTSYKTAWHLTHRIREAMSGVTQRTQRLSGTIERDETYIGGKIRGKRSGEKGNKMMVLGAVERGGNIRLRVDRRPGASASTKTIDEFTDLHVSEDVRRVMTDEAKAYGDIGRIDLRNATRESVNHSAEEWVRGDVHTNTIESAWSLFKRSLVGSYHHLSLKHMDAYLDEFEFRFNNRTNPYLFRDTMKALIKSDTLTYSALKSRTA